MDEAVTWSTEPVKIANDATTFTANGKVYHKASTVSFQRYGWMERLNLEVGYGRTVEQVFGDQRDAFDLLNKQKFAEAAVKIDASMRGVAGIADGRTHPMMKLALLFWNFEGEDISIMTDDLMASKVADMEKTNFDFSFFFFQALTMVPGLLSAYRMLTDGFLKAETSDQKPSGSGSDPSTKSPSP